MTLVGVVISDYVGQLKRNGFTYVGRDAYGWLKFTGQLNARGTGYACEFTIPSTLDEKPFVTVTSLPKRLPALQPHLSASGYLCYLAPGSVALDMFDPIGQTLACLKRAGEVLADVLAGEMLGDLADEFYSHWGGHPCILDIQSDALGAHPAYLFQQPTTYLAVITDDKTRTDRKLAALGFQVDSFPMPALRVESSRRPFPVQENWPPRTVGALLKWQSVVDPACRRRLEEKLLERYRDNAPHATVVIDSPGFRYGFGVIFKRPEIPPGKVRNHRVELYSLPIYRMKMVRVDDQYMAERSLPDGMTLKGLSIGLVGCGTIGGYLADMLVKAGAGTSGGRLVLVDFDELGPQNLGRHRLGMPHLFKNKAKQMLLELERMAPGARMEAETRDVRRADLGKIDLLIDATGMQGLTDWLMWKYTPQAAVLATWVEGPGLAVRALMKAAPEHACSRCISQSPNKEAYQVFDEVTPTVLRGHGCEGLFVPFPATASIQAAALAMEMVQAWVNGTLNDTLQTRVLDRTRSLKTPDCVPPRQEGCLACSS